MKQRFVFSLCLRLFPKAAAMVEVRMRMWRTVGSAIAGCTAALIVSGITMWAQTPEKAHLAPIVAEINDILRAHPDAKCQSAELTIGPSGQLTVRGCYTFRAPTAAALDADHIATFEGEYVAVYCKNSSACVTVSQGNLPTASEDKDNVASDNHIEMFLAPADEDATRRLVLAWRRLIAATSSSPSPAK